MKTGYGKPRGDEPHIKQFYCALHNGIPVTILKDFKTKKPVATIEPLWPVPVVLLIAGTPTETQIAVCGACLDRVGAHMGRILGERPPEDPEDPKGGGGVPRR